MEREQGLQIYNANSGAAYYRFGTRSGDNIYYRDTPKGWHIPVSWARKTVSSTKKGKLVKFNLQETAVHNYVMEAPTFFCTVAELEATGLQPGEAFEFIHQQRYEGATKWVKNSTSFWVAGDVTIHGDSVQLKFRGAQLATVQTLERLLAGEV